MACFKTAFNEWRDNKPRTTNPSILSLHITSDGYLLGRTGGSKSRDTEGGSFFGRASDILTPEGEAIVRQRQGG